MIAWWWLVVEAVAFFAILIVPVTGIGRRLQSGELQVANSGTPPPTRPALHWPDRPDHPVCHSRTGTCRYLACAERGACLGAVVPALRNQGSRAS